MHVTVTTITRVTRIVFLVSLIVTAILFWQTVRRPERSVTGRPADEFVALAREFAQGQK
jgi:hypothetical protein